MAGSQSDHPSSFTFTDPVLDVRLEALKLLAEGLSERVAVLDRNLNVIYANRAAWPDFSHKDGRGRPAKCYEAFANRTDPCGTCPATKLFESQDIPCLLYTSPSPRDS